MKKLIIIAILFLLPACANATGTWTTLDMPGGSYTYIYGIDGSNLVGFTGMGSCYGGLYNLNSQNWTALDMPGAESTQIFGIDGSNLVGCTDGHGFLYNLDSQEWITINMPGATATWVHGIDGSNLIGYTNYGEHGFLYNLDSQEWITLDMPGAIGTITYIYDICGDNLVGTYGLRDMAGGIVPPAHGFVYTIPEPAAVSLLFFSLPFFRALSRRRNQI